MSTQIISFLIFGIAFILLYFFYKKEDRKKIMIVSGIIFLTPFSFGFFQIPRNYGLLVLPLIVGLFVLFRYYKGHYRYFFLFFAVYFIGILFSVRSITIINNQGKPVNNFVLTSNLSFTYKTGEKVILPIEGGELINNMGSILYIETIEYGTSLFGSENNSQIIKEIPPYSCNNSDIHIDYFFQDPPVTINISRKQGDPMPEKTIKYWLHD